MLLVKDVLKPLSEVAFSSPFVKVRDIMKQMHQDNLRSVIVERANEHDAYGIVTYKDILEAIVAEEGDVDLLNVYDIYSKPAIQVHKEMNVKYVAKLMIRYDVRRVMVMDGTELIGVLSMQDIIEMLTINLEQEES